MGEFLSRSMHLPPRPVIWSGITHASYPPVAFLLFPSLCSAYSLQKLVLSLCDTSAELAATLEGKRHLVLTSQGSSPLSLLSFTAVCTVLKHTALFQANPPGMSTRMKARYTLKRSTPECLFAMQPQYLTCSNITPHLRGIKMKGFYKRHTHLSSTYHSYTYSLPTSLQELKFMHNS